MNGDEFKKLLKKSGDATSQDYPDKLYKSRREKFILWTFLRTPGGCLFIFLIIIAIIYFYGTIVHWW